MNLQNFRLEIGDDAIALLVWDCPNRSMNVLNPEVIGDLSSAVEHIIGDPALRGCVITSGKDSFSSGADLTMLETLGHQLAARARTEGREAAMAAFFEGTRQLSLLYRRIETGGKPFACAINGLCLGGGFELALACHYRVVADSDKARVGLPEIKVGLFPGGGGTQRVARLMPTPDALQMLFRGDQIRPAMAKAMNLVHEIAPVADVVSQARAWIAGGGKAIAPWDEKTWRAPSGKVFSPGGMMIWPPANAIYRRETFDNYPAAKAILTCVYEGLQLPMDSALKVESRQFASILRTPEAAAMIRTLFGSMGEINKGLRRPKDQPVAALRKIGIIGAGFMGAGIGLSAARAGLSVVLIDRDQAAADKGKAHAEALLTREVMKGRATLPDRDKLLALISPTPEYAALADCDLVIEAVFEDRAVKAEAIRKAQGAMRADAVLASNTSTLPISSLAENFARPDDFLGLHFFSPVEKMPLVEIIMGAKTGPRALGIGLDFVKMIKKTPIVVNDARGFFANRCVGAYIREGHLMLGEGVPAAMIENLGRMAGMPVGPLALNDEVALDLAWKVVQATKADLGANAVDPVQEKLLEIMVVKGGRPGRKNAKGFYDYPERGQKRLWPGLADLQTTRLDLDSIDVGEVKLRLLIVQALEAARAFGEGIVTDPREADVGSILGFGFAPFTGGVLSYIDGIGLTAFVAHCDRLSTKYGARFACPEFMRDMARQGRRFYDGVARQAA